MSTLIHVLSSCSFEPKEYRSDSRGYGVRNFIYLTYVLGQGSPKSSATILWMMMQVHPVQVVCCGTLLQTGYAGSLNLIEPQTFEYCCTRSQGSVELPKGYTITNYSKTRLTPTLSPIISRHVYTIHRRIQSNPIEFGWIYASSVTTPAIPL